MFRCRSIANQHETLPRSDASPPERKRVRRSPADQTPAMQPISYPHHPQQQQQQPGPGQGQGQPSQPQQQNLPPQQQQNQSGQPMAQQIPMHSQQQMMMMRQMGINGPIGPPGSQPPIGQGSTPLINNPLMMHGTPGGMHVRVPYTLLNILPICFRRCIAV